MKIVRACRHRNYFVSSELKPARFQLAGPDAEVQERLLAEQARAEVDRERLLDESAAVVDSDGAIEELSRLSAKSEVLTRRLAKMATEITSAQEQAALQQSSLSVSLERLQLILCGCLVRRGAIEELMSMPRFVRCIRQIPP